MIFRCFIVIGLLSTIVSAEETLHSGKHLFIFSGQSNMKHLRPGRTFLPKVASVLGRENIIAVKEAQGGEPIRKWVKDWRAESGYESSSRGVIYDRLLKKIQLEIEGEKLASVTFLWMQGEQDAVERFGKVYAKSLRSLLKQLQSDLGWEPIHFIIGRLSDYTPPQKFNHWNMIRNAQMEVAESYPFGAWVNTDDLNDLVRADGTFVGNDLHYTPHGYKIFAERLADKSIELIRKSSSLSPH